MATPHVAGAAVLLAQKHPEWTGQQIKDALMSTSVPTPDYSPYQAGTGRLNVAAAYDAGPGHRDRIGGRGARSLVVRHAAAADQAEDHLHQHHGQPRSRWISPSTTEPPPQRAFTMAADHVTVPARGTSTVDIMVDPNGLASGQYAAQVTARLRSR